MSYLILPSRRTRQPSGVASVDPSYPYARNLRGAWLAGQAGLLQNASKLGGLGELTAVGAPTIVTTPYGLGVQLNGSSQYLTNTSNAAITQFPFTFFLLVNMSTAQSGSARVMDISIGTGISAVAGIRFDDSAGYRVQYYDGGNVQTGATNPAKETWHSLAGRFFSVSERSFFFDGALVNTNTETRSALSGIDRITIGFAPWGAEYLNGIVAAPLAFDTALPDAEIAELHRNPWRWAKSDTRRLWFAPSGGGTTVITSSGAASLVAKATAAYASTHSASAVARPGLRATAATTSIRTATVAARTTGRGTAATTSLRTGIAAGRVSANAATTYSAIVSGTFAAAGRATARATAAYASTHNATAAATTAIAGAATTTTLRTGIAAARVDARAAVTAAALVAGTVTTTAAAQISARASVTNTTERIAAVAAMLALRGANPAAPELPVEIPPSTRSLFPDRSRLGLSPVAPSKPRLG